MTKRWQQIISCYLAFCMAAASAINLSPRLHVWLEHGGRGAVHTHPHGGQITDGAWSRSNSPHAVSANRATLRAPAFTPADHSPALFGLQLTDVYRAIGHWLAHALDDLRSPRSEHSSGHTHHSLAQMLAGGVVEILSDVPPLIHQPALIAVSLRETSFSVSTVGFDPQTASRPPPFPA